MNGIVLAAGRGSRMAQRTADRPKAMVVFAGRPLIEHQLCALRGADIRNIAVVDGYMASALVATDITRFSNPRWADSNMVTSLRRASAWLATEDCIVSYADIFYTATTVTRLAQSSDSVAISFDKEWSALWRQRFSEPLSDAEAFKRNPSGHLIALGGRAARMEDIEGQYMGLVKFTPDGWRAIERILDRHSASDVDKMDMTSLLALAIKDGVRIGGVPCVGAWGEVDSEHDLALYESMYPTFDACVDRAPSRID